MLLEAFSIFLSRSMGPWLDLESGSAACTYTVTWIWNGECSKWQGDLSLFSKGMCFPLHLEYVVSFQYYYETRETCMLWRKITVLLPQNEHSNILFPVIFRFVSRRLATGRFVGSCRVTFRPECWRFSPDFVETANLITVCMEHFGGEIQC